jgi:hypothetical protein
MSQFDFANLNLQYIISEAELICVSVGEQSAASTRAQREETCSMEEEVCEDNAVAACDSYILTMTRVASYMDLDESVISVSQSMFEPARYLNGNAPPKRFYRTFWRSAAMRILALSSTRRRYGIAGEPAHDSNASRG